MADTKTTPKPSTKKTDDSFSWDSLSVAHAEPISRQRDTAPIPNLILKEVEDSFMDGEGRVVTVPEGRVNATVAFIRRAADQLTAEGLVTDDAPYGVGAAVRQAKPVNGMVTIRFMGKRRKKPVDVPAE